MKDNGFDTVPRDSAIFSQLGAGQGCHTGGLLFNGGYALPLTILAEALDREGLVLKIYSAGEVWWDCQRGDTSPTISVVDVTFVDDECVVVTSPQPTALGRMVDTFLKLLVEIVSCFNLHINWVAGKTECFVSLRGQSAHAAERDKVRDGRKS